MIVIVLCHNELKYTQGFVESVLKAKDSLDGYTPRDIAPLFAACVQRSNVSLPARFWAVLK